MPRYAHTESGAALDPADASSEQAYRARFQPSISGGWTVDEVPRNVTHGARVVNGQWVNPPDPVRGVVHKGLTLLAFLRLCQKSGGMTDEMLVACDENPLFKAFWIKFRIAEEIVFDDEDTDDGLTALAAAGYLPNGAAAVKAKWPVA